VFPGKIRFIFDRKLIIIAGLFRVFFRQPFGNILKIAIHKLTYTEPKFSTRIRNILSVHSSLEVSCLLYFK
jgi:hypothetical protein